MTGDKIKLFYMCFEFVKVDLRVACVSICRAAC